MADKSFEGNQKLKTDKFQFIELNGRLMWCDFGANLVQHFIGRYSQNHTIKLRYQTILHDIHDIKRYSQNSKR